MSVTHSSSKFAHVLIAAAVVVVLGGLLAGRLMGSNNAVKGSELDLTTRAEPAAASIPDPLLGGESLDFPRWAESSATAWPVAFKTDLDMLAPLGDGEANAAEFFKAFSKPDGPRYPEAKELSESLREHPTMKKVLPFDQPILAEAEAWCDQASMHFYDEVFPLEGYATRITNLLVPLHLARTWVARGLESEDPGSAMEDFRRAIRLGRLLRQDDVVVISDLVGLAIVGYGAEGIFIHAQKMGDADLAVKAAVVLSEVAPQRLLTSQRLTDVRMEDFARLTSFGKVDLELPEPRLLALIDRARNDPNRRFRCEAALALNLVFFLGPAEHREQAEAVLLELASCGDSILEQTARWSLETEPTEEYIAEVLELKLN